MPDESPLAELAGLPEPLRERLCQVLPYWRQQGSVECRVRRNGHCRQYLRVRVSGADGRQYRLRIALGGDPRVVQRILQLLERQRYAPRRSSQDQSHRLHQRLQRQRQRQDRELLRALAPSRAQFRAAWRQLKAQGVPCHPEAAWLYTVKSAARLSRLPRGRPRKFFFPRPATPLTLPPPPPYQPETPPVPITTAELLAQLAQSIAGLDAPGLP
jgi:phytoene dehydrogenase-like protein